MAQRVRKPHRGRESFVCHTTPHFDSTSREVSYSVPSYHTRKIPKCKSLISTIFPRLRKWNGERAQKARKNDFEFGYFDEKTLK